MAGICDRSAVVVAKAQALIDILDEIDREVAPIAVRYSTCYGCLRSVAFNLGGACRSWSAVNYFLGGSERRCPARRLRSQSARISHSL